MESIKNILDYNTALCKKHVALFSSEELLVNDIESLVPEIKELFKLIENKGTKQLAFSEYSKLLNIMNEWNGVLGYFKIKLLPCNLRPFLWNSPKVAIKRIPRKGVEGIVVSTKMQKTAIIEVVSTKKHPIYGKMVKQTKRYKIHDPNEECRVGDRVLAHETRRFSKTKHHIFYRKIY